MQILWDINLIRKTSAIKPRQKSVFSWIFIYIATFNKIFFFAFKQFITNRFTIKIPTVFFRINLMRFSFIPI